MENPSSKVTLVIKGIEQPEDAPALSPEVAAIVGKPRLQRAYDLQPIERGEEPLPAIPVEAKDDDLMELQLDGDHRLLISVADYRARFCDPAQRGVEDADVVEIDATLPLKSPERGIFKWGVKALKLIGIDLTGATATRLARYVDEKKGFDGLYGCPLSGDSVDLKANPSVPTGSAPLLIFIHGTMSSTDGSFGGLWTDRKEVLQRLAQRYQERSFAFEHKTFTQSPIANALALANALPAGARLHLVSHSRGGMVGELICRASRIDAAGSRIAGFDDDDFALFSAPEQQTSRWELLQLADVLQKKGLVVERFVRVASPTRGTTLASGRLDRFLSAVRMGVSFLKTDWGEDATWFVAAVVKERTDPAVMPGLEAMMPGSATVKLLNRPGVALDSDLRVIAGDYQGGGIFGAIANWVSEGFYSSENDVVVNTPSMYGGGARLDASKAPKGWYLYAQGAQVFHFNYFKNPLTAGQLANGLLQDDARGAGFLPLSQAPRRDDPIARGIALDLAREDIGAPLCQKTPSSDGTKPFVIVVPGCMGTHLKVGGQRIWIDFDRLAFGDFGKLAEDAAGVESDGMLKISYQALGDFLSTTHEVIYFPFDWRLSLTATAKQFADFMGQVLEAARTNSRPVRILAHSFGGLLVRMAAVLSAEQEKGWWEAFRRRTGSRFVMAGTPNNGTWAVPYAVTGRDAIVRLLDTVDLRHNLRDILAIVSGFVGFLEMLPQQAEVDCCDPATWQAWSAADGGRWPVPAPSALGKCRETAALLQKFDFSRDKDLLRYVAGIADETPSELRTDQGRLYFCTSPKGDGRVLWDSGIPEGVKAWYMNARHGDLLCYERGFQGLLEIVGTGETTLLPAAPPAERAETARPGVLPDRLIPFYPNEAMLQLAALGGEIIPTRERAAGKLTDCFRVAVCHGDIMAAKHAVAVGHYVGDTISGTEAALDRRLGGLLSQRHALGIYPGPEGTTDVFVREFGRQSCVALVVGLGQVGDLTPAVLTSGFAAALLRYATTATARRAFSEQGRLAVSTILIGSGAGWGLGVRDSVRALIEGACRANALLSDLSGDPIHLSELEFLEVFEDRALQALRAVREFASLGVLGSLDFDAALRPGGGGRCRAVSEENEDWWQRIKVEVNEQDEMKFTTLTGLARIEETVQPTQRALVDRLVEQAVTRNTVSQDDMVAIYNLISPLALKERSPDQGDVLMMLDERSACYPWEMMHFNVGGTKIPLALRSGLVRQLSLKEYRQRPVRAYRACALVIAEPRLAAGAPLPQLPGARKEGESVAKTLGKYGYDVTHKPGAAAMEIVSALYADQYRILHLAGHGIYNHCVTRRQPDCSEKKHYFTGMVLDWPAPADGAAAFDPGSTELKAAVKFSGAGAGRGRTAPYESEPVFLTSVEVKQMSVVPELVFINCCYLGKTGDLAAGDSPASRDRNLFAASLATAFIGMGVRAVVAAGWAVNDDAAAAFAAKFYDSLLGGSCFGEAVSAARKAANEAAPDCNTWAAYQCYGDPAYRLEGERRAARPRFFLVPREAVYELWAIRQRKRGDDGSLLDEAALMRELQQVESLIPHEWLVRYGEIRSALAAAYAEFGNFDVALEQYEAAFRCSNGGCTLDDLDRLANLKARWAEKKVISGELAIDAGRTAIREVLPQLEERSAAYGDTAERSSITASVYQLLLMVESRQAQQAPGAPARETEIAELFQKMAHWYEKAARLSGESDLYPALNWICARILELSRKAQHGSDELTEIADLLTKAKHAARSLNQRDPSFWHGMYEVDAELYWILLDYVQGARVRELCKRIRKTFRHYLDLADRTGTTRKMDSVAKQVRFIATYLPGREEEEFPKTLAELAQSLESGADCFEGEE